VAFDVTDRLLAIVDNASTSVYAGNWLKEDYTDKVISVNGQTGAVEIPAIAPNTPITAATKTKISYDEDGLVTAGSDATTADIADSTNKRYVNDAQLTTLSNLTQVFHVRYELSTGIAAGSSSAATIVRAFNTEVKNTLTGASLAANRVTIPAGTYEVSFNAPAFNAQNHRAHLYNVTDSALAILGSSEYSGTLAQTNSICQKEIIVLTASKTFELRHKFTNAFSTYG